MFENFIRCCGVSGAVRALSFLVAVVSFPASAFCGFYVSGGGAELFNNATQVALMRRGTRTILSMQNDYQGPLEDFAMVVPVPVVLKKEQVKTLKKQLFTKLDRLTAPRLVEYWEQDPCPKRAEYGDALGYGGLGARGTGMGGGGHGLGFGGVRVEAQFDVGEYEVVILSAEDALGLERWLVEKNYKIPPNAAPLFKPYVQQGMKFFVAKVNAKKVELENGHATLSPLRFHYDAETFSLPIRLGLINAKDAQDLIVYVLSPSQRYEVANAPNVTIPTNIDLVPSAKSEFGPFYASLFDRTQGKQKGAVVTEYAWATSTCDPCPTPPLQNSELIDLGLDVLDPANEWVEPVIEVKNVEKLSPLQRQYLDSLLVNAKRDLKLQADRQARGSDMVVTRLHARYTKDSIGEDLVFRAADAIQGGREVMSSADGSLERGAIKSPVNNFQARYAVRYPWTGPAACKNPVWGVWGGKPSKGESGGMGGASTGSATNAAFAKRDVALEGLIESPIVELELKGKKPGAGLSLKVKPK